MGHPCAGRLCQGPTTHIPANRELLLNSDSTEGVSISRQSHGKTVFPLEEVFNRKTGEYTVVLQNFAALKFRWRAITSLTWLMCLYLPGCVPSLLLSDRSDVFWEHPNQGERSMFDVDVSAPGIIWSIVFISSSKPSLILILQGGGKDTRLFLSLDPLSL